jgi:MarR family transcriptional regulator, transcriptional regulator for hemolysin
MAVAPQGSERTVPFHLIRTECFIPARFVFTEAKDPVPDEFCYARSMGTPTSGQTGSPNLALLLTQAGHALQTELTASLAALGMSPRAHCVLSTAMTGELTQARLAELCGLDTTTMVVTVDELEKAGLAERRLSTTDRRARIIAVTQAGREMVARGQEIVSSVYEDVLGTLPEDQRQAFVDALERLVAGRLSDPPHCDKPVRRRALRAPQLIP